MRKKNKTCRYFSLSRRVPTESVQRCRSESEAGLLAKRVSGQKDGGPSREPQPLQGVRVREDETCH